MWGKDIVEMWQDPASQNGGKCAELKIALPTHPICTSFSDKSFQQLQNCF